MAHVVAISDSPEWEPNAPEAVLITDDSARAVLALNPHFEDIDRRAIALLWQGVYSVSMGYPNDEGLTDHPLYYSGLDKLLWMGEVHGGPAVPIPFGPPPRHFVVPLREAVVEVLADAFSVARIAGTTHQASGAAMDLNWNELEFRFQTTSGQK